MDEAQKALQFVSISSDGNVNLWTLTKSELIPECLMKLRVVKAGESPEEDPMASGPAGGCCMDFCKVGHSPPQHPAIRLHGPRSRFLLFLQSPETALPLQYLPLS